MTETIQHNTSVADIRLRHAEGGVIPPEAAHSPMQIEELPDWMRAPAQVDEVYALSSEEQEAAAAKAFLAGGVTSEVWVEGRADFVCVSITKQEAEEQGAFDLYGSSFLTREDFSKYPELMELVSGRERSGVTNAAINKVRWYGLDRGVETVESGYIDGLETITQAFDVDNGRSGRFRIFNFSNTMLGGDNLRKVMDALRIVDDETGGASSERLKVIVITPQYQPGWGQVDNTVKSAGGTRVMGAAKGIDGWIALNEALLIEEKNKEASPKAPAETPFNISEGLEAVVIHELGHIVDDMSFSKQLDKFGSANNTAEAFGWTQLSQNNYEYSGTNAAPSVYGSLRPQEDTAESFAGMQIGKEWLDRVSDDRLIALDGLLQTIHSGNHGPSFMRCTELLLEDFKGDNKFGTHQIKPVTLRPKFSYFVTME